MVVYTTSCFKIDDDKINEEQNAPYEESGGDSIQPQQRKEKNEMTIPVSSVKQENVAANSVAPIFKCTNPKSATKVERKFNEASCCVLKEKGVLPVHKANPNKLIKVSLPGFIASSKGLLQEESEMSKIRISDGCDPSAHTLVKRSNPDFSQPTALRLIEAKPYILDIVQRFIQSEGGNAATPKVGLSYTPP